MPSPTYQLELNDQFNFPLSDITGIAFDKAGSYRLNRPTTWQFRVPCNDPLVSTIYGVDGRPYLTKGRRLKVRRTPNGGGSARLVANNMITRVERQGDENNAYAIVNTIDPMFFWPKRPVRNDDGSFTAPNDAFGNPTPMFPSPISGADMILRAVANSVTFEGSLGLDTFSGNFDLAVPPAADLGFEMTNTPITIADLATLLTNTGELDIGLTPIEEGIDLGGGHAQAILNAVSQTGADLSTSVHFDYGTGLYNVKNIRHVDDIESICNRLWYYLGPPLTDGQHWGANITGDDPHLPGNVLGGDGPGGDVDYSNPLGDLIVASRIFYGVFMDVRMYDAGYESDARDMFRRLWQTEVLLRVNGREMIAITAVPHSSYLPFEAVNVGDIFTLNTDGDKLGVEIASAQQRLYGFDVNPDNDGIERLGEFVTSADAE